MLPDLRNEQEGLRESVRPYSLLLVNLDVKNINFSHGHDIDDSVLRSGVAAIKEIISGDGRVYRYSGAEFVVSLPGKTEQEAGGIKTQLLEAIAKSASRTVAEPEGALSIHHGVVMLDP